MKNSSMHNIKKGSLLVLLVSMVSCGFLGNDSKEQNNMDAQEKTTIQASKEDYIVQPNYEHPKFKELDAAFAKQEHRFEIDRCEFKYNDHSFFIGDSIEKVIGILGEPDKKPVLTFDGKASSIKYKKLKLFIFFSQETNKATNFSFEMSKYSMDETLPYKIIKIREVPYHLDMTLNEFMELSDLEHDKNLKHGSAAFYIIDEKECLDTKNIKLVIGSRPSYEGITSGGGHMTSTRDGDFRPERSNPIKQITVRIKK